METAETNAIVGLWLEEEEGFGSVIRLSLVNVPPAIHPEQSTTTIFGICLTSSRPLQLDAAENEENVFPCPMLHIKEQDHSSASL